MAPPPYVHMHISREEAEERVTAVGTDTGIFLIRTQSGKNTFCIMYKGKPTHHIIGKGDDGFLTVNKKKYGEVKSLKEVSACVRACSVFQHLPRAALGALGPTSRCLHHQNRAAGTAASPRFTLH